MRTTTKRVLSTPYWILGVVFFPFMAVGIAFEFIKYWFNEGRRVHKDAVDLFKAENNDPEYRV